MDLEAALSAEVVAADGRSGRSPEASRPSDRVPMLVWDRAPALWHYLGEVLGVLEPAIELRGGRI